MIDLVYGREALRRRREQKSAGQEAPCSVSRLEDIPLDAPLADATISAWDGDHWVEYDEWRAARPPAIEEKPQDEAQTHDAAPTRAAPEHQIEQVELWR